MPIVRLAVVLGGLLAARATAGPLLSATFEYAFRVGSSGNSVAVRIDALQPVGTLTGGNFTLAAGRAFHSRVTVRNGDVTPNGQPAAFMAPLLSAQFQGASNGRVEGRTTGPVLATRGLLGLVYLRAKIGKAPAFTLLAFGTSAGPGFPPYNSFPHYSPSWYLTVVARERWNLGVISVSGLTTEFAPAPNDRATGGVSVTPQGNTHIMLVSLARVHSRGLANFGDTHLAKLTLVYAPEPERAALLSGAALVLAAIGAGRRRRPSDLTPARPRLRDPASSARRRARTSARSA